MTGVEIVQKIVADHETSYSKSLLADCAELLAWYLEKMLVKERKGNERLFV